MSTTATALVDDVDLEILEFDRPVVQQFEFLGFSVHCSAGALRSTNP